MQDSDGDFADWHEPIALPTSGTVCVKVATGTSAGNWAHDCTAYQLFSALIVPTSAFAAIQHT